MLNLIAQPRDRMYTSVLWESRLTYPVYIQSIGFYHTTVGLSHGADDEIRLRFKYGISLSPGERRALHINKEGVAMLSDDEDD